MTPKQKRVFNFIRSIFIEGGISPTYTEIMEALNIKSKSVVAHYLNALEEDGKIKINRVKARGIEIEDDENTKLKKLLARCRQKMFAAEKNYGFDDSIIEILTPMMDEIDQVLGEE